MCDKPGYAYTLFKIHKLDANRLQDSSVWIFLYVFSNLQAISPLLKLRLVLNIFFNLSALSFAPASSMNTAETTSIIS